MTSPISRLLPQRLSRRERQIMEVLYQRGSATVAEVQEAMTDPPGYSAVRRFLALLEEKNQVTHSESGNRFIYSPAESWNAVSKSALEQVVETFFGGSLEQAVATMLSSQKRRPSDDELRRVEELIQRARAEESIDTQSDDQEVQP